MVEWLGMLVIIGDEDDWVTAVKPPRVMKSTRLFRAQKSELGCSESGTSRRLEGWEVVEGIGTDSQKPLSLEYAKEEEESDKIVEMTVGPPPVPGRTPSSLLICGGSGDILLF